MLLGDSQSDSLIATNGKSPSARMGGRISNKIATFKLKNQSKSEFFSLLVSLFFEVRGLDEARKVLSENRRISEFSARTRALGPFY